MPVRLPASPDAAQRHGCGSAAGPGCRLANTGRAASVRVGCRAPAIRLSQSILPQGLDLGVGALFAVPSALPDSRADEPDGRAVVAADGDGEPATLTPETLIGLFSDTPSMSVSQLEKYAACPVLASGDLCSQPQGTGGLCPPNRLTPVPCCMVSSNWPLHDLTGTACPGRRQSRGDRSNPGGIPQPGPEVADCPPDGLGG